MARCYPQSIDLDCIMFNVKTASTFIQSRLDIGLRISVSSRGGILIFQRPSHKSTGTPVKKRIILYILNTI